MKGFRGARQYQDGPPAWTRPEAFAHAGWPPFERFWPGELSPLLKPLGLDGNSAVKGDNRGLYLTTEALMHSRRGHVLGWVRDMLGLRGCEGWRPEPPAFLSHLIRDFYKQDGQAIAWVMVEACRDSIRQRHVGFKETLLPTTQPAFLLNANGIGDRVKIPLFNGIELSTQELDLMLPKDQTAKEAYLTQMTVQRKLTTAMDGKTLTGQWMTWCLASPENDREALARGSAPASGQWLLPGYINPARLMTWMKLDLMHGLTYSYAIDVERESGRIFSIRYAGPVKLRMQIELDPWLDDWLLTAIRSF